MEMPRARFMREMYISSMNTYFCHSCLNCATVLLKSFNIVMSKIFTNEGVCVKNSSVITVMITV